MKFLIVSLVLLFVACNALRQGTPQGFANIALPKPDDLVMIDSNGKIVTKTVPKERRERFLNTFSCLSSDSPHYQLCKNLDCDACSNTKYCGYCKSTQSCLPGNTDGAECPGDCLQNWIFEDKAFCIGELKAGKLNNVAPEATHLITAEYTGPKLRKTTSEVIEAKLTRDVVTAMQHTTTETHTMDEDGIVEHIHQASTQPETSDLVQKGIVRTDVQSEIHDLVTGERLDVVDPAAVKTVGIDQVPHA